MKDLTVLIPIRVESLVRLENVLAVIRYLRKYFETNIMVLEADKRNNGVLCSLLPQNVDYIFVPDNDPVFYRTKYINQMAMKATTEFLAIWDADVVSLPSQVYESIIKLRSGKYDICYPYEGIFLDTSKLIRDLYLESEDITILEELNDDDCALWHIYAWRSPSCQCKVIPCLRDGKSKVLRLGTRRHREI